MAPPVILALDVHCHGCAKRIRNAVMKLPGVDSVTFGTGHVMVEGTADAAALRAWLQAKTGKAVSVVSGSGGGSSSGDAPPPPPPAPAPAPIILEMKLHCRSCAKKVEKRVMQIPGVDTVTTDVAASRVKVTGTADASAVVKSLQVRTRTSVRVVSDESRRPAVQPAASSDPLPSPPLPSSPYGAAPPLQAGYCYPPALGVYGGQYWAAAPSQPPAGFCTRCPAYPPPPLGYYPWQGGEVYGGQQMAAPFQHDENPCNMCRVQ